MLPDVIDFGGADLAQSEPPQPFPLTRASELTAKPTRVQWLLENFLECSSLNLLFGEPAAGKSLFALDWAFCLALGIPWHGYRTEQTDVVVIAGEGFAGMARRLKALEIKYDRPSPDRLFISERPANLIDEVNAQWVADSIKALCPNPGLIVVDTLHRNMAGDENSSSDIAQFIGNLDNHLRPLGAAVLVVHHSGHGTQARSRGSSSIRAAMDGEFSATKDGLNVVLSCTKAKDFEAVKPQQFSLKSVELPWLDDDDEPLKSVYLEHAGDATERTSKRRLSARDDAILTALNEAIQAHGVEPSAEIKAKFAGFGKWSLAKVVHVDHWRELAYEAMPSDQNKRQTFWRLRGKLRDEKYIVEHGDFVWKWPDSP